MGDLFQNLMEHRAKRPKMTKAQLLEDFDLADDAYLNMATERDMEQAYRETLETHLRAHGCEHNFGDVADEPESVA